MEDLVREAALTVDAIYAFRAVPTSFARSPLLRSGLSRADAVAEGGMRVSEQGKRPGLLQ
jgi:hypothetical protein